MSFDSTIRTLRMLLEQVDDGGLQLPEFQRDYVWGEDSVVSLLASIAKGYPVGALLMLEQGGEVRFEPRPIEGTSLPRGTEPDLYLLDGQQRMTSLYQVLWTERPAQLKNVKNQKVKRHLFIDIRKAVRVGTPFEDAVEIMAGDKRRMADFGREVALDLSTPERQYEHSMFPLDRTFRERDWLYGWRDYWRDRGEDVGDLEKRFDREVLRRIQQYEMPIIKLTKDNGREAVCTIFEKVNVGGVKLDAFELVTAMYAGSDYDLRRDWAGTATEHGRLGRIRRSTPEHGVHAQLKSLDFLQACTVLHTREVRERAVAEGRRRRSATGGVQSRSRPSAAARRLSPLRGTGRAGLRGGGIVPQRTEDPVGVGRPLSAAGRRARRALREPRCAGAKRGISREAGTLVLVGRARRILGQRDRQQDRPRRAAADRLARRGRAGAAYDR